MIGDDTYNELAYKELTLGYVVDFIDFRIWPVFNMADTALVIGVGLLIYYNWKKILKHLLLISDCDVHEREQSCGSEAFTHSDT